MVFVSGFFDADAGHVDDHEVEQFVL
jgi:hypothetical protein